MGPHEFHSIIECIGKSVARTPQLDYHIYVIYVSCLSLLSSDRYFAVEFLAHSPKETSAKERRIELW